MRLIDFFDDKEDMTACLQAAIEHLLPLIDRADEIADPVRRTKISTALFIIFTYRAVVDHGLDDKAARQVIDELLVAIREGRLADSGL